MQNFNLFLGEAVEGLKDFLFVDLGGVFSKDLGRLLVISTNLIDCKGDFCLHLGETKESADLLSGDFSVIIGGSTEKLAEWIGTVFSNSFPFSKPMISSFLVVLVFS